MGILECWKGSLPLKALATFLLLLRKCRCHKWPVIRKLSHHKPGRVEPRSFKAIATRENPSLWYAKMSNTSPQKPLFASHSCNLIMCCGVRMQTACTVLAVLLNQNISMTSRRHLTYDLYHVYLGNDTDEVILCPSWSSSTPQFGCSRLPFLPLRPSSTSWDDASIHWLYPAFLAHHETATSEILLQKKNTLTWR